MSLALPVTPSPVFFTDTDIVGSSATYDAASSCIGPVEYPWGSIIELELQV